MSIDPGAAPSRSTGRVAEDEIGAAGGLIQAYVQYFISGGWTSAIAYGVFLQF